MSWSRRLGLMAPLVVLALGASFVGIHNQFTYDDVFIVKMNVQIHHLDHWWHLFKTSYWAPAWGGDGYRPLTTLGFAIQWAIGGGSPMIYHGVNVALNVIATLLMFALGALLLPTWAAWIIAALFAVHPVHVEAIANVVGQSELSVAVAILAATVVYVRARQRGSLSPRSAAAILVLYALACLLKENGITLPAVLAVAELVQIRDERSVRARFVAMRPFALALVLIAVTFLAVRTTVLASNGFAGFQPFVAFQALKLSNTDRILTMFGVVPHWIRLFMWPARLSSEYAPPDIEIAQGFGVSQLPGLLMLIGVIGLAVALWRKRPVTTFGIAWICITLLPASNFIVPAGIILAERTLYLPSVGAMLVVGDLLQFAVARWPFRWWPAIAVPATAGLLFFATRHSSRRTEVWHDNDRLFRQAVQDAPEAYRAHYMLGAWEFDNKRKREGEKEYRIALKLFPYDPFLAYNMAEQYRAIGLCEPAIPLYKWATGLDSTFPVGHSEAAWCLLNMGDYLGARSEALVALRRAERPKTTRSILRTADSAWDAEVAKKSAAAGSSVPRKVHESMQKTTVSGVVRDSAHLSKPF